jgi:hypothetical protein
MSEGLFTKEQATHLPKNDIMKNDFGWEVPVESVPLPSRGVVYDPNGNLYRKETLQIRAMTAQDEDILTSQALIKDGQVVSWLIRSCLVDKSINVDEMIGGDRIALMVSIRITGYGADYQINPTCENCGHRNEVNVDLSSLGIKRLAIEPVEPGKNLFSFQLPVSKKVVVFKFLNSRDEKERQASRDFIKKQTDGQLDNGVTSYLENCIVSIDNITDKLKVKHFIKYMPARDSKALRKYIAESEPGLDMSASFSCSNCGTHNEIRLPVTSEFFWPDT